VEIGGIKIISCKVSHKMVYSQPILPTNPDRFYGWGFLFYNIFIIMKLDKDKLVIEELSRMKSLFGYERGKVISEQKLDEDTIGSYDRRDLQRIDPGGSHLSAGDKAAG
jgi:hypothetical protein